MNAPPTLRTYASPESQERAILEAAAKEFTTVGVRRASMDDVAKASGVSRSTLYRRFANKDVLLAAVVNSIMHDGQARLVEVTRGQTPRDAVVEAFCESVRLTRTNPLMRKLLESEPGAVQTLMGFGGPGVEVILHERSIGIAETLRHAGAQMPADDLRVAAEVMLRIITSLGHTGSQLVDIDDEEQARDFASKFLAPLVW